MFTVDFGDDSGWKESFFKDDFSVDQCLSKYTQKSDLETLRRDLKNYGVDLQQQMSEILKTETEAIVNLAEYLTNLNSKIENLSLPVSQLREEIMTLFNLIELAERSYKEMLENVKDNNIKKNNLRLKLGIISSSVYIDKMLKSSADSFEDLIVLERVVNKYSFQRNYINELGIVSSDIEIITQNIENRLVRMVNENFLKSFKNEDSDVLTRCLRMYDNLSKQEEALEIFRTSMVLPYLEKLFTESNLERSNQNLDKIYEEVLYFMDTKMSILDNILSANPDLTSYNFTLHSFWKEFDLQSRQGLPHITAPGNPELFQKRFKSTWNVLLRIAKKCGNENLITENETFQEHLKRFNLPVYFEIRYQRIAGNFETDILVDKNEMNSMKNELSCKFKPTVALWVAVSECFHENSYLDQLADQFLKLSMMLLSRYLWWFQTILQNGFEDSNTRQTFIMDSLVDLSIVETFMAPNAHNLSDIENTVFKIVNPKMIGLIIRILKSNRKAIEAVQSILRDHLVNAKYEEISISLQNVGAIPRLYRRTNRSVPKDASSYMINAVKPIVQFHNEYQSIMQNQAQDILDSIISRVSQQYLTLVQSVLQSVCKTEESLRRLKSRTLNAGEESTPHTDTVSDEMKIREQIKLDVAYFLDKLYPLGSTSSRGTMDVLKKEIM
nr:conserved oligomeric Golgi complex subunit 2 [Leptinotarsa decemlineata]